jgi:type IV pilus assembly protein PilY1
VAFGSPANPQPLFTARDASGNAQPITTRLEVGRHPTSGVIVYVGTGKYLETADNSTTSTQSYYGIWDNGSQVASRSSLLQQQVLGVVTTNGLDYRATSTTPIDWTTQNGWYIDLPTTGERQVTDSVLSNGKIIFTTMIPDTTPCSYGGSGWLMELDALGGSRLSYPVFDVNGNAVINADDMISYSGSNIPPSGQKLAGIPSSPGILGGAGGSSTSGRENKYINLSSGTIQKVLEAAGPGGSGRVSWKQIQ